MMLKHSHNTGVIVILFTYYYHLKICFNLLVSSFWCLALRLIDNKLLPISEIRELGTATEKRALDQEKWIKYFEVRQIFDLS